MNLSINQIAQQNGDTSLNEVNRRKVDESAVLYAWRSIAHNHGEGACSAEAVSDRCGLPVHYVVRICWVHGYTLAA